MYWFGYAGAAATKGGIPIGPGAGRRVVNAADPAFGGDLQAAVDAMLRDIEGIYLRDQGGGLVYLPPGCTFYVKDPPLRIRNSDARRKDDIRIVGGGPSTRITVPPGTTWRERDERGELVERAIIELRGTPDGSALDGNSFAGRMNPAADWILENLTIDGGSVPGLIGLRVHASGQVGRFRNLRIENCPAAGVCLQQDSNTNVFDSVHIRNCGTGVRFSQMLPWAEYCQDTVLVCHDGRRARMRDPCQYEYRDPIYHVCNLGPIDHQPAWVSRDECSKPLDLNADKLAELIAEFGKEGPLVCERRFFDGDAVNGTYGAQRTQATNSVSLTNCLIEGSHRHGVLLLGGTNNRLVNTTIRNSGDNGLAARYAAALHVEGCRFEGNAVRATELWRDPENVRSAQVYIGDARPHSPEPHQTPDPPVTCVGVNFVGCQFVGGPVGAADAGSAASAEVGVRVNAAEGCWIQGCLFEGHWGPPIWVEPGGKRVVILGNRSFDGLPIRLDAPSNVEDFDTPLGAFVAR